MLSSVAVHRPREAHNVLTGQHLLLPGSLPQVPRRSNVPTSHIREDLMPISIQYAGFQVQPHGRDYSYYVLNPPAPSRHFIFTISHQAFAERQILYQDAADLCYQKLQRALLAETGSTPCGPTIPFLIRNSTPIAPHTAPPGSSPGESRVIRRREHRRARPEGLAARLPLASIIASAILYPQE